MASKQSWQFGLRALIVTTTVIAMALGVYVCPQPVRPLLFKAIGGMALFIPVLLAVCAGDWFERGLRGK
jgi:hypothetical protein